MNNYFNGYMITKEYKIITEYNGEEETHNGCYILVKNNIVSQDFFGCYGAYVDKDFNFFDNLYNISKLKNISLNKEYYNKLIISREVPFTLNNTLFNEFKRYNGSYKINLFNKEIEKIDYRINSINYTSPLFYDILDKWYFKWINIFKNINGDIIQDLSGGIDTRILLSISINADILDKILIRSKKNSSNKEVIEDYKISSKLINYYNLPRVEKVMINKINNDDFNYIVGNSNFTASLKTRPVKKLYRICGNGGLLYHRPNTFKNLLNFRYKNVDKWLADDYNKYCNLIEIPEYIKEQNLKELYIYRKLIVELRDGIKSADYFRANTIMICPMMDPDLNILNPLNERGQSILPYIILKRYCPKLLDFKIEGMEEKNLLKYETKTLLDKIPSKNRKKVSKIFFTRYEKEKPNNDGSHSLGTDFLLINRMLKNDNKNTKE